MQSGVAEVVRRVRIGSCLDDESNEMVVAVARNQQQSVHSKHVLVVHVHAGGKQHLHYVSRLASYTDIQKSQVGEVCFNPFVLKLSFSRFIISMTPFVLVGVSLLVYVCVYFVCF